jgi:hypothetical protein
MGDGALLKEVSAPPAVPGAHAQAWAAIRELGRHSPAQFVLLAVPEGAMAEPDNAGHGIRSGAGLAGYPGGASRAALGAGMSVGAAGMDSAELSARRLQAVAGAQPAAAAGLDGSLLWPLMDAYSTDLTAFMQLGLDAQVDLQHQRVSQ